jgi:ABC-type branched-subunit amino acid transport system substrate-binding protein
MPMEHTMTRLALCGVAALLLTGCTLVTDFDECSSDAECPSGSCVDNVCEGAASCTVHNDCRSEDSGLAYCISGRCATIDETLCEADPRLEDPDTPHVHIGLLMPLTGRNETKGVSNRDGVVTALKQLNQAQGGIDGSDLSLISCDTVSDPTQAEAAAEHLINDLGISVVIGALLSDATLDVAQNVTIDAGALLVSPASTSPLITTLDDGGLVWRTVPSDELQGPALSLVRQTDDFARVAVLFSDNNYGNGLFNELQNDLAANAPGLLDDEVFQTISYTVDRGEIQTEELLVRASNLFDTEGYLPDAIFVLGSAESQQIIRAFDQSYFGDLPDADKPVWVLTDGGRETGLFDPAFDDVRSRIIGTAPQQADTPARVAFETRFEAESAIEIENATFADNSYDAAVLTALVLGAANDPLAPTPDELSGGMARLASGDAYSPSDSFSEAVRTLAEGGSVDYVGASGELDFDVETGDVSAPIVLWRISDQTDEFIDDMVLVQP